MKSIKVTRRVPIPDCIRLEQLERTPELGPKILFFSGGSALRGLSCELVRYTHNSIHLITPFDSGGSSAVIRDAFNMLAVGDIRNRLMALADHSVRGNPEIFSLFSYRFPEEASLESLKERLGQMIDGHDSMIELVDPPMRKLVRSHLHFFRKRMPEKFDLRGASIGNLILAGGYLNYARQIDPVIYLFSKLVEVRGLVRPITGKSLHLAAELRDGSKVMGQSRLTAKGEAAIKSPVNRLFLTDSLESKEPVEIELREKVSEIIRSAQVICYPMGSFYSSLMANFLLRGVGNAIGASDVPKIYIPNTGTDPEQLGMSLSDLVQTLGAQLEQSSSGEFPMKNLLQYVLIDSRGSEIEKSQIDKVRARGVEVVDVPLVTENSSPYLDAELLAAALVSFS